MKLASFKDFSAYGVPSWLAQAKADPNVSVYWDQVFKCFCREVRNVRVTVQGDQLVPEPGQLITYPRSIGGWPPYEKPC